MHQLMSSVNFTAVHLTGPRGKPHRFPVADVETVESTPRALAQPLFLPPSLALAAKPPILILMEQLLAGPTSFIDAALSTIEAELLSTDTPHTPSAHPDSGALLEARRAAQAWQKLNLTKERQRWEAAPDDSASAAAQLAQLRALLHDVPDPAAAILCALDDAARAAGAAAAAQAELTALREAAARVAASASSHGETAAQLDAVTRQASSLQEALATERTARDVAERRAFSAAEQLLGLQAAHTSEVEHLTEELRRLSQRVREAEAEAARARSVVATGSGSAGNQSTAQLEERNAELAAALVVKERASARLSAALTAAKKEAADAATDAASARSEASTHRQAAAKLRHELERRPQSAEVEALQRSVAALQSCLSATESAEIAAAAVTCASDAEAAQAAMPALLMGARRRALDAERRCEELSAQLAAAVADLSIHRRRADEAQSSSAEKVALVQRLEADLHACSSSRLSEAGEPDGSEADGELSLLDVVRRQRDRLKQRALQLEDDLAAATAARDLALARIADSADAAPAKATRMPPADSMGARIRRRAAAMVCLGGDRKGHLQARDEEGGVGTGAHLITSTRPAAAGLAGRATLAAALAYAALVHIALLRARAQQTC